MSFVTHFESLEDPRRDINRKHELLDIIFLTVTAVLSGAEGWKGIKEFGDLKLDWLRKFRPFANGIPVDDTIARVISVLKPERFNACFLSWVNEVREKGGKEHIAMDGKTLRRSFRESRQDALHSITVWCTESRLVLTEGVSTGKKNENQGVIQLIESLELTGTVVTVDALNTQRTIAEALVKAGAGYYLCVKNNQKSLREEIAAYFHKVERDDPELYAQHTLQTHDKGHGRIETRTCSHLPLTDWVSEGKKWKGAASIVMIQRERILADKVESETQYYLSTEPVNPEAANRAIRDHWGVENAAHWVLDMTFREDESRIRRGDAPEIMASVRRLAMNLIRRCPIKNSVKAILKQAAWSDNVREKVIGA